MLCFLCSVHLLLILGLGDTELSSSPHFSTSWGLGMLSISIILPSSSLKVPFFFFSLYLVAFAQGSHKPCAQAFGADQFSEDDPQERVSKSSFFNWWYFGACASAGVSVSWLLGFGIPCCIMLLALVLFLLGTRTYQYFVLEEENPFLRVGRYVVAITSLYWKSRTKAKDSRTNDDETNNETNNGTLEEAKGLSRLFPIWATCLIYGLLYAQSSTFFTEQASTLDRKIGKNVQVPPAALQAFIPLSIICFVPIYDKLLVLLLRKITHIPSGITTLQRIRVGLILSLLSIVIAALVEIKRLNTAKEYELVDKPNVPIPMSFWWIVPQYILSGTSDVFTIVGMQEFFYDQVPDGLRSLGLALYLSVLGVGSFLSSFLISIIDEITSENDQSWFSDNLNLARLDYFYLLLAGLCGLEIVLFVYFARRYVYKKRVISGNCVI
ncbi:hypothetical protein LUZ60_001787 [Juncus effusus]|nr:hypothetical protein LUZ60_001787 [Juncus effusus]